MTEPVADLRHLSARLPEDETGGDPQTGEGAIRLHDRAGDRQAGDPALVDWAAVPEVSDPDPTPDAPEVGDADEPVIPVTVVTPDAPSEPLIPADTQPDVPADQPAAPAAPQE